MTQISSEITKLFADRFANLFIARFFLLSDREIIPTSLSTIRAWFSSLADKSGVHDVDHLLGLLASLVEKLQIRRVCYVCRRARRIHNQLAAVRRFVLVVARLLRLARLLVHSPGHNHIIDVSENFFPETLTKMCHHTVMKRGRVAVFRFAQKELEIRIFTNLLDGLPVCCAQAFLDDQSAKSRSCKLCRAPGILIEQLTVPLLDVPPWNLIRQNNPTILSAEFSSEGKIKVLEFHLMRVILGIHPCLQVQGSDAVAGVIRSRDTLYMHRI